MPFELVCRLAGVGVAAFGSLSAPSTHVLLRQLSDSDASFLRWASGAVLAWEPSPVPPAVPVHHIHGRCDHVLPAARTDADVIVDGAGHVLSLTHAREVNEFLRARMELFTPSPLVGEGGGEG
jgi:pimeloyl-ACP methyl ester carboxylesterase